MAAHCENGVTAGLLRFNGVQLSEPMVFGIGSGLFFSYLPFLKVNYAPGFSFRTLPGWVFKRVAKRLNFKIESKTYKDPAIAMQELDKMLEKGVPVGLQVGVYNLTYFPDVYRFHFNAHNIVVFGKENGLYHISDPVMENVVTLSEEELIKVRFAKGAMQPKGRMYFPVSFNTDFDLKTAIINGIKRTAGDMVKVPIPLFGVRGIKTVSKKIRKWPEELGNKKASLYLAQIIRMQEEIGTGGAGFRFIYAAFLQEAAKVLEKPEFRDMSLELTAIGDRWREWALIASRNCKDRAKPEESYDQLADIMLELHHREKTFFTKLLKIVS